MSRLLSVQTKEEAMLLSTVWCAADECDRTFNEDAPMWQVVRSAEESGWVITKKEWSEVAYCPEHADTRHMIPWHVGCRTCEWEEDFPTKEEAEAEASFHTCDVEEDTFIHSPEEVERRSNALQEYRAQAAERRSQEQAAEQAAKERQERIERYASQWLRLYNSIFFWKKEHI